MLCEVREMADGAQRVKGKAQAAKDRVKRETGIAAGCPGAEISDAAHELKGKARDAVAPGRSAMKKARR